MLALQLHVQWGMYDMVQVSYDLKMGMKAYWEVATWRMVDNMVLHLMFNMEKVVNKEMSVAERILDELMSVAEKMKKLHSSVEIVII